MKRQFLLIMLIMCLISSACGGKNALKPSQGNEKQSLCPAAEVTGRADYQVILSTKLVKKVLNEISFIPNFNMANFWKDLSPETSDELNFQLNIILINNPRL
jgi:hypothetical protein